MLSPLLPDYSPSLPAPSYSYTPSCGEQTLDHTPRTVRPTPTGTFIKKDGKTTIVLNEQEDNAKMPTYGRQGVISGTICLEETGSITAVVLKLQGKLDTVTSEGGSMSIKLFSHTFTLYNQENSQSPCSPQIPISALIPTEFKEGNTSRPLPPSFSVHFSGLPSLMVKASYSVSLIVTRIRHRKVGFWHKTKHIVVPFNYYPRTRSYRPIIPSPCFFSSVKTSPEEWYQAVSSMKARPSSSVEPINCHLFIPGSRIYGLTDVIPFHVQLTGSVSSLLELFPPSLNRISSADSYNTTHSTKKEEKARPTVRVYIMRQVSVDIRGTKSWRNTVLGEGTLWPMPPNLITSRSDCGDESLDWEGELSVGKETIIGGFSTASVHVKDFIALSVTPENLLRSSLLEMQLTVPIRLVTDSWSETSSDSAV